MSRPRCLASDSVMAASSEAVTWLDPRPVRQISTGFMHQKSHQ